MYVEKENEKVRGREKERTGEEGKRRTECETVCETEGARTEEEQRKRETAYVCDSYPCERRREATTTRIDRKRAFVV